MLFLQILWHIKINQEYPLRYNKILQYFPRNCQREEATLHSSIWILQIACKSLETSRFEWIYSFHFYVEAIVFACFVFTPEQPTKDAAAYLNDSQKPLTQQHTNYIDYSYTYMYLEIE